MAYIKKEPIVEFITKGLNNPDKTKAYGYDAIEILAEIEYTPTADVVEVKHGYWVRRTSYPMGYNCSECYGFESYKRPFCCVCGAKMDLSEKPTGCERNDT